MENWPTQRIHVSWLVAAGALGVVVGVVALPNLPFGLFVGWQWLVAGLILIGLTAWQSRRWMIVLAILAGLLIGFWRGSFGQVNPEIYAELVGQTVTVSGRVLEDADIDKRGQTVLRLSDLKINQQSLPGNFWVTIDKTEAIKRSDIVEIEGKVSAGFGAFVGTIYRAELVDVKRPVPGDVAVGWRDWFAERVRSQLPETEAALGLGFLLGLRRALPPDLIEALKIAGLTHVIVASGYNLTILVRLARRLFVRVSKYLSTITSVAMILGFMTITGLSPSMSRAGLVAGLSLAAWYYGRKIHPLVLIPLAAAITLLVNPQFGWNDLGWQLSFAAFAGVIILAPLAQRYFFGEKEPGNLRQVVGETISAQVFTLPLIVLSFGFMSNVAVLANALILPLVPLAMLLTFLVGVLASVPIISSILATITTWLLGYMVQVANWLAGQTWAQMELQIAWWQVVLAYLLLGVVIWWMQRQTKMSLKDSNVVV